MQPVDFTTLMALVAELKAQWLPAKLEQVYQRDRFTVCLALRTLSGRSWLTLSWHPQAARLCIDAPPPRTPDTFTFSQQLRHQLGNLALVGIEWLTPWERVLDLQFGPRPGDPVQWHLYVEVMGKYSNVILVNSQHQVIAAGHQVGAHQSRVRQIQTGQPYDLPPLLLEAIPSLEEPFERWRDRLALVPGPLQRNILRNYRGLSSALAQSLIAAAGLEDPQQSTDAVADAGWVSLFGVWGRWLQALELGQFHPHWLGDRLGYGVVKLEEAPGGSAETTVQQLVAQYYARRLDQAAFGQLQHQISQKLQSSLAKLYTKAEGFRDRLQDSDGADALKGQADLLMAHLHQWQPGMTTITLADFVTTDPVTIALDPDKNAVQNAQRLYRRHQKLKRTRGAVEPLLEQVQTEICYLEQVEEAVGELSVAQGAGSWADSLANDLEALREIRDELVQQGYLESTEYRSRSEKTDPTSQPYRYITPNGLEVLVGRNNRQNDHLTFRVSGAYDLWFHTQEIAGSHVLLRLTPGTIPDTQDLNYTAAVAAYHSRARQSEQVPVVYTKPKFVYKPKGAKPGMIVYKHEKILWGQPLTLTAGMLAARAQENALGAGDLQL